MTVRLDDAAAAAVERGESHYAFPLVEGVGSGVVVVALVRPDQMLGWRITMIQGRYDGVLEIASAGQPTGKMRRQLANMIFHPTGDADLQAGMPTAEAIRRLEGYDHDVVLHPDAARTVTVARQSEDRLIPIVRQSPFLGLQRTAGYFGGALLLANMIAVLGVLATWGSTPAILREYVLSTTIVTLGCLAASPLLLLRMTRESSLFVNQAARQRGKMATVRVGQLVILLAVVSAVTGMAAVS